MIKSLFGFLFFQCLGLALFAGGSSAPFHFYHLPNGMETILLSDDSNSQQASILIRGPYFTEAENSAGLSYCLTQYLCNGRGLVSYLSKNQAELSFSAHNYFTEIKIRAKGNLPQLCFNVLDSLRNQKLVGSAIKSINKNSLAHSKINPDPSYHLMWSGNIYTDGYPAIPDSFQQYNGSFMQLFRQKMLQNNNILFILPYNQADRHFVNAYIEATQDQNSLFPEYIRNYTFEQEMPLLYSYQLCDYQAGKKNFSYHFFYHAPGAAAHKEEIMSAVLLGQILSNPKSLIHNSLCRKLGLQDIQANYDITHKSGEFGVQISSLTYQDWRCQPDTIWKALMQDSLLLKSDLKAVLPNIAVNFTHQCLDQDAAALKMYWAGKNFDLLQNDTVVWNGLSDLNLHAFMYSYLLRLPYLLKLEGDSTAIKDSGFLTFDDRLFDYRLHYKLNNSLPENSDKDLMLSKMLQFLKINPNSRLQVNASADASEFLPVKDLRLASFLDTVSSMQMVSREIVEKKSIRLDMVRALKLLQYFYRNGIGSDRLSGSCQLGKGTDDVSKSENRFASFMQSGMRQNSNYHILTEIQEKLEAMSREREAERFKAGLLKPVDVNLFEKVGTQPEISLPEQILIGNTPR